MRLRTLADVVFRRNSRKLSVQARAFRLSATGRSQALVCSSSYKRNGTPKVTEFDERTAFLHAIQEWAAANSFSQPPQGDLAILAGSGNPVLAQSIANKLGVKLTPCRAHIFSEGNVFVRIRENVRGRDTFIIQGVHYPVNDNSWSCCSGLTL